MTILEAVHDPALFGPFFRDRKSWRAWEAFLSALFGLPLSKQQVATYQQHTGRKSPPKVQAPEAWLIVGRRGGKSRIAAVHDENPVHRGIIGVFRNVIVPCGTCGQFSFPLYEPFAAGDG